MAKCKKRRFRDEISAKLALATIARKDKTHRDKNEKRYYRCPDCGGLHLTSRK